MNERWIEAGRIVNTHGLRGEVKVEPWCDGVDFLLGFEIIRLNGKPYNVEASRAHGTMALLKLEGIDTVQDAQVLKNTVVFIDRTGVELPPGRFFVQDLIGLSVVDEAGASIGVIFDVLKKPAQDVYHVTGGDREHYIPVVDEFVKEINIEKGYISVKLIEGM